MNQKGFTNVLAGIITAVFVVGTSLYILTPQKNGAPPSDNGADSGLTPVIEQGASTIKTADSSFLVQLRVLLDQLIRRYNVLLLEQQQLQAQKGKTYAPKPYLQKYEKHAKSTNSPAEPGTRLYPAQQFAAIEDELRESKAIGSYLAPEHYKRIESDLTKLESQGYSKVETARLHRLAIELSPHLGDQARAAAQNHKDAKKHTLPKNCTNTDPVLTADITNFPNIRRITAPGSPSSEGPKGHSFIWTSHEHVPVYAPIDAVLDNGAYYTGSDGVTQYILTFRIKNICDMVFKFDHIDEPVDRIRNAFPGTPRPTEDTRGESPTTEIFFSAGELIGYTKGTRQAGNWDFGLYNMAKKGALADSYGMHSNAVCWVDFYSPEKQTQYRNLLEGPELVCSFHLQPTNSPSSSPPPPASISTPTPAPAPTTTDTEPTPLSWILPFEISDLYDPTTKSRGDISFAGSWVIIPFGGNFDNPWVAGTTNPDMVFEVVPGTILRASAAGRVSVARNPVSSTPEGEPFDPQDWELHITIGNGPYWIEYDHMVDMLVSDGDSVELGQPLGKASPASIRHGGIEGQKPVDEFEWGLRRGGWPTAVGDCPMGYLTKGEQAKLMSVLDTMRQQGFTAGETLCLSEELPG